MEIVLLLHAMSTVFMAGIIWFVQIVHYPLFNRVEQSAFPEYQRDHSRLTTLVVVPPMLLELGTGVWLALDPPSSLGFPLALLGLGLLLVIWGSTFTLQVPAHGKLSRGFEEEPYRRLTRSNWIRTTAWSLRVLLVTTMLGVSAS